MIRRIFGPRRDEAAGELSDMYTSPKCFRVIKSRIMKSVGYIARMGKRDMYKWFWWGKLKENTILNIES